MDLESLLSDEHQASMDFPSQESGMLDENGTPDFSKIFKVNYEEISEIEKQDSTDLLVELTIKLAAHVTEHPENVQALYHC